MQVKLLSGGNQQKVLLAREMFSEPKLLIAAQPTRGLDIGAIEYVHRRIIEARAHAAVLLISTELSEVLSLSDRIAVMYGGEIMGIVPAKGADVSQIGEMMAGVLRLATQPAGPRRSGQDAMNTQAPNPVSLDPLPRAILQRPGPDPGDPRRTADQRAAHCGLRRQRA